MARRKTFPSYLFLFVFLLQVLLPSSNSASLTSRPSWTSSHQLKGHSPEFNVVATDDGVPTLESGENPAKDPQIIEEGPLPINTPDPIILSSLDDSSGDGEVIDSTPLPPSDDTPAGGVPKKSDDDSLPESKSEPSPEADEAEGDTPPVDSISDSAIQSQQPKPSSKPWKNPDEQNESTGKLEAGNLEEDEIFSLESSAELEEEDILTSDSSSEGQQSSGLDDADNASSPPESSLSPDDPPSKIPSKSPVPSPDDTTSSKPIPAASKPKPTKTPKSVGSKKPWKPKKPEATPISEISDENPSASVEPIVVVSETGEVIVEDNGTKPKPSSFTADDAEITPSPAMTVSVPKPSSSPIPTAIVPTQLPSSGSMSSSPSPVPSSPSAGKGKFPTWLEKPTDSPASTPAVVIEQDEADFVQTNATYTCLNFAGRAFPNYTLFDENSVDGSVLIYKGSGVSRNPTLPVPYRYHAFGKKWSYHLNVSTDVAQNIILGFAEVFPKACASGKSGAFRVFTVSVGDNFEIFDIMKSSGCGNIMQTTFEGVKPKNRMIDIDFNAISGKAMLSVVCYGNVNAPSEEITPVKPGMDDGAEGTKASEEVDPFEEPEISTEPEASETPTLTATKQSAEQCYQFGEKIAQGFTNVAQSQIGSNIQLHTEESAVVSGTSYPQLYKSHIFGKQFAITLDAGSARSIAVELGFAEVFEPGCKDGFRIFSVQVGEETKTVDVFKEVGCNAVFTLQLQNITAGIGVDGKVDIVFKAITNFAMLSSVCVINAKADTSAPSALVSVTDINASEEPVASMTSSTEENAEETISPNETFMSTDVNPDEIDEEMITPQASPLPKENGIIVASTTSEDTGKQENPSASPFPKVNGLIDASITTSPAPSTSFVQPALGSEGDLAAEGEGGKHDSSTPSEGEGQSFTSESPTTFDELLESGFSQTTIGEGPAKETPSSSDPTDVDLVPWSPNSFGASGSETDSPTSTPPVWVISFESPGPNVANGNSETLTSPTNTPIPTATPSTTDGGSVTDKQGDISVEALSPSPSIPLLVVGAPSPSSNGVGVTVEAPSPSSSASPVTITVDEPDSTGALPSPSSNSVIIIGTGPVTSESSEPTPTAISAAAFSPVPSAGVPIASSSPPAGEGGQPSTTPEPLITAVQPDTSAPGSAIQQSPSPSITPTSTSDEELLPPVGTAPTTGATPLPSALGTPAATITPPGDSGSDGIEILTPVNPTPSPEGGPTGSNPIDAGVPSPTPIATISQNQIIIIPSASAQAIPTRTPTPVVAPPSPTSSQVVETGGTSTGIGAPEGVVSTAPDAVPTGSPIPDVVANPAESPVTSSQATPSPSRATSSVGSSQVIVDSSTTAPTPDPSPTISLGSPDEGPIEVTDNTTEIIQVTGDTGTGGSEEDNQPSILVGEYKDIIATTPAGSGFSIGMGIVGSLLVILLLVCLFFAIFRRGGAAYSYSSGYSRKQTDYDPSQGRDSEGLGMGPSGYGNEPSYGQNTQDGYGTDGITLDSRRAGNEAFRFEMPAAGGLGAPADASTFRDEEPDAIAEYSSLNLQQASGYDTFDGTANYRESRETDVRQSSGQQPSSGHDAQPPETRTNDSHGSNPGEYTFTGTFTMPQTGLSQGETLHDGHANYRDPGPSETEQLYRGSNTVQDSFNDNHSVARPTTASEPSGKQERGPHSFTYSKVLRDSSPTLGSQVSPPVQSGVLVDDIRSSLLDSEQESSSYIPSTGSNPITGPSPYETGFDANMSESDADSGNVIERHPTNSARGAQTHPSWLRAQQDASKQKVDTELSASVIDILYSEPMTDGTGPIQAPVMDVTDRPVLPSSRSNDGPWPWWWSEENLGKHRGSVGHRDHLIEGKENSSLSSNSVIAAERNSHSRDYPGHKRQVHDRKDSTKTAKGLNGETNQLFVPDSSWCRQYSSTSDEDADEDSSNPYFDKLRSRREPYVRSVANRLSTGPGSFAMKASRESDWNHGGRTYAVGKGDGHPFGHGHDVSSWISRDPVEI